MQQKQYWELSQESTLSQHILNHAKAKLRPPSSISPVSESQESPIVIMMYFFLHLFYSPDGHVLPEAKKTRPKKNPAQKSKAQQWYHHAWIKGTFMCGDCK